MKTFSLLLYCVVLAQSTLVVPRDEGSHTINIRLEGQNFTIFDGYIHEPHARMITTKSGGTHECNGLNNGANKKPGPTCTSTLAQVAKREGFTFDGTYDKKFEDFFITRIGHHEQDEANNKFWGLLVDYQFTKVGGCQQEVQHGQHVLWAFDAFNAKYFLRLSGPTEAVRNVPFNLTVTDGMTGDPVKGAKVIGRLSDENGHVTVTGRYTGTLHLQAKRINSVRSNRHTITIRRH